MALNSTDRSTNRKNSMVKEESFMPMGINSRVIFKMASVCSVESSIKTMIIMKVASRKASTTEMENL